MSNFRFFIAGPPKSGTCTIIHALRRAGVEAQHCIERVSSTPFAVLLYRAFVEGRDPLGYIPRYVEAIADAHVTRAPNWESVTLWPTHFPDFLPALRRHRPTCWILLNTRPVDAWIESVSRWKDLRARIIKSDLPFLPPGLGGDDELLGEWISGYYQRVRQQFEGDPFFLEFDITDPGAKMTIEKRTGLALPWWGVRNENPKGEAP